MRDLNNALIIYQGFKRVAFELSLIYIYFSYNNLITNKYQQYEKHYQYWLALFIISCRNARDRDVSGTYTREWTFEQNNLNTGKLIGMAKFRDTVFIKRKSEGFEISNNRWRLNDYDEQGWHERSEGILHTYPVSYDPVDSTLVSKMTGMYNPVYINANEGLYKGNDRTMPWKKVK